MRAESVIYPLAEGLEFGEDKVVDLTALTDAGSCENVTYSVTGYDVNTFGIVLVDGIATVTNEAIDSGMAGTYQEFTYVISCDDDVRSVSGTISIYIITTEP